MNDPYRKAEDMTDYQKVLKGQREYFQTQVTKDVSFRLIQLRKLYQWIEAHEEAIEKALWEDLNKAPFEAYATEIGIVKEEIRYTMKHLRGWAATKQVPTPITQFPSKSRIYAEPYGVVLIMSPWNYPFQLTIAPLVAAIGAGNCAVLKPSAYSQNVSRLMREMTEELFVPGYVCCIEGGRQENESLLNERFDYIFFTGSMEVGKYMMKKAAEHLTPVSLELGGKSPCIVDETANLKLAAKRIVWGKFLNAGQTCVAPDYVLVHKSVRKKLLTYLKRMTEKLYGMQPCKNREYPKIINEKHFDRLCGYIDQRHTVVGGEWSRKSGKIEPTILTRVSWDSPVMQEEIFGPILPVLVYEDLDEAIAQINSRPKPLALYLFTRSRRTEKKVLGQISYGGGCVNDTVVHLATSHMPFGGVGESGMGSYHGKAGFDTFTHRKSILKKALWLDLPVRYPPYKGHLKLLKKLM